jgi:hypothetical protein
MDPSVGSSSTADYVDFKAVSSAALRRVILWGASAGPTLGPIGTAPFGVQ